MLIFTGREYLNFIEHIIVETNFQQAVGFTVIHSGNVYEDGSYGFGFFDDRAQIDQRVVELEKREVFKGFGKNLSFEVGIFQEILMIYFQ